MPKNPIILLPQLISSLVFTTMFWLNILALLTDVTVWFLHIPATLLLLAVGFIVYLVVSGMYPLLVRDVVNGANPNLASAAKAAFKKVISLIAASIIVSIIIAIWLMLFVVPGLIFLTWFFYTIPALMLEDKGALEAMAASRSFGRDKKLNTLAVIILLGIAGLIGSFFIIIPLAGPIGSGNSSGDGWLMMLLHLRYTYK